MKERDQLKTHRAGRQAAMSLYLSTVLPAKNLPDTNWRFNIPGLNSKKGLNHGQPAALEVRRIRELR